MLNHILESNLFTALFCHSSYGCLRWNEILLDQNYVPPRIDLIPFFFFGLMDEMYEIESKRKGTFQNKKKKAHLL
jgi:hypothetical protein